MVEGLEGFQGVRVWEKVLIVNLKALVLPWFEVELVACRHAVPRSTQECLTLW